MNNCRPNSPAKQIVDLLDELDRIIAAHGLIQYRFTVEILANSLKDGSFGLPGVITEILKGKINALRATVLQALECRLGSGENAVANSSSEIVRAHEIARLLREGGIILETARHESAEQARNLPLLMPTILEAATTDLFQAYLDGLDGHSPEARSIVTQAIGRQVGAAAAAIRDRLENCRTQVAGLLRSAKEALPDVPAHSPDLPLSIWQQPLFDSRAFAQRLHLRPVGAWRLLGQAAVRRRIHRQLETRLSNMLTESLSSYSAWMRKWIRQSFCALEAAFFVRAHVYQAHLVQLRPSFKHQPMALQTEDDIRLLQRWPEATRPPGLSLAEAQVKPER